MARFKFALQSVLEQRAHVEKLAQMQLAKVQLEMQGYEQSLRDMERTIGATSQQLRDLHLPGPVRASELLQQRRYIAQLRDQVLAHAQVMSACRLRMEQARQVLAEASRGRKALEILRDKQFAQWASQQRSAELRQLDEIGTNLAHEALVGVGGEA